LRRDSLDVCLLGLRIKASSPARPRLGVRFSPPGVVNPAPVTFVCSYTPQKITGISNVVALDVGPSTFARQHDGPCVLLGRRRARRAGDGNGVAEATPVLVKGGLPVPQ
jgi:hypothetical protein